MTTKIRPLLATLLLVATACSRIAGDRSATALPAPWVEVVSASGLRFSIDTSRLVSDSGYQVVWMRFDWTDAQHTDDGWAYHSIVHREDVTCDARVSRSREMTALDSTGAPIPSFKFPDSDWRPFEQNPMTDVYPDGACLVLRRLHLLPHA